MYTKSGNNICATFFAKSLDKMAGWWYNGISGAGIRQRAAKKSSGKIVQKIRVEKFSTRNMKFSVNWSDCQR